MSIYNRFVLVSALSTLSLAIWSGYPAKAEPLLKSGRHTMQAPSSGLPQSGERLLNNDVTAWSLTGAEKSGASITRTNVSGKPFSGALRIQTQKASPQIWDTQLIARARSGVKKGDTLFVRIYARAIKGQPETGEGRIAFIFERNRDPYTKSVEREIACTREWKRFDIPFTAVEDLDAGQIGINLRVGLAAQIVEIGGVEVWNFGSGVAENSLPRTRDTYRGREANAAWRKAAKARIEKIRKGPLALRIVDASGRPIPGATVSVEMTKHAFPFGSAVAGDRLLGKDPDAERYRKFILANFSQVVLENDLKWQGWESRPQVGKASVDWLLQHGITVRGHNLIWPSWRNMPEPMKTLKNEPAVLRKTIADHITEEASALRGKIIEWDVVNEPFDNHDVQDILGRDVLIDWFRLARKADPKPRLTLNDYPPLDGAAKGNAHLNSFYQNLTYLKTKGAPIGGIGFQCHFGGSVIAPEQILTGLDRFSKLTLPIAITEFDVNSKDDNFQADYTRDFMTAAFSHPSVHSILMWGFWEGQHWLPDAALIRRDWSIKPNGKAWLDLVKKQWWTRATGKTNSQGRYNLRGFYGNYRITVTAGGKTKTQNIALRPGAKPITLKL